MPTMSQWTFQNAASARGAILIQAGIAIFVLMGLTAFVIDYGVLWLSRRQAQNAADAGALAGAVARAFDETANPPSGGGPAEKSAKLAAQANNVWGDAPVANVTWACPSFAAGGRCVQVDVFQDGTNGSKPLPVFFAHAFSGVTSQGVKATASAIVETANASNTLRPWMIPDRFSGPDWGPSHCGPPDRSFVRTDTYTAPTDTSPGTGYVAMGTTNEIGCELVLNWGDPRLALGRSNYYEVDLAGGVGAYMNNIVNGAGVTYKIGDQLQTLPPAQRFGSTLAGVTQLLNRDRAAYWNGTRVVNSCAPGCAPLSPRIVPIALFSPLEFFNANRSTGQFSLTIVNILGLFLTDVNGTGTVTGRIVTDQGELFAGSTVGDQSAFNVTPALIR
jgi:hypothetical protein